MPSGPSKVDKNSLSIATGRLLLRLPERADIENLAQLFANVRVTRWLAVGALELPEAREFAAEFVADCRREMADAGCAPLIVTRRALGAGDVAGYCGLRSLPGDVRKLELVYAVIPDAWRDGIVSEAARACFAWAFATPALRQVVALTRAGNSASLAVMAGLGMRYAGETEQYYGERLVQFELARADFEAG